MNPFELNKDFYNQPIHLTAEQISDPMLVLKDFFSNFHLYESRALLAAWLRAVLTTPNPQFDEAADRSSIIVFAEKIEELLEALSVMVRK